MPAIALELGDLAAFLFLLLIAAALWVLIGLLNSTFGRVPVIGSWITANISAALNDARNAVLSGAGSTWGAGVKLFFWIESFIQNTSNALFNGLVNTFIFAQRIYQVTLPNLESRVLITASSWVSSAESYATSLYNTAVSGINAAVASALVTASGWFTTAERDAVTLFDTATADIANAVVRVESDAASLVTNASSALQSQIRAAELAAAAEVSGLAASVQGAVDDLAGRIVSGVATAETTAAAAAGALVGGVYTDLETWADRAVADAWPDAAGELAALRGTLGADFPWLNDLIGALGGLGAAGLAGALIRSMATSQAVTRLANDCVVPQCRNLGGYGNDLSNLLGVASTAALLAWMVEAAANPAGWARDTDAVLGPIASGATQAARTLLGVG